MSHALRRSRALITLIWLAALLSGCGAAASGLPLPGIPTTGRTGVAKAGPAVLGGTDAAFIADLGQPGDLFGFPTNEATSGDVVAFDHYPNTFIDAVTTERDSADTRLAHRIVLVLLSAPPDAPWSPQTARTTCIAFAPADARYERSAPVTHAQGLGGSDTVYFSATLARTFPGSQFVDDNGAPVTPGFFNIQYIYPTGRQSSQILSCQLALGTRQTGHL